MTTKARVENYQVSTLAALRLCKQVLRARGEDAARYGLIQKDEDQ